jgi:hypothetical protein
MFLSMRVACYFNVIQGGGMAPPLWAMAAKLAMTVITKAMDIHLWIRRIQ